MVEVVCPVVEKKARQKVRTNNSEVYFIKCVASGLWKSKVKTFLTWDENIKGSVFLPFEFIFQLGRLEVALGH